MASVVYASDETIQTDPFVSYYNLIGQTPFAIVLLKGPEFIIEVANDAAFSLWGKQRQDVLKKNIDHAFPELIPQGFKEILRGVYNTGQRFVANELPVTLLRNGQQETLYVNFSYDPLRNDHGSIIGIIGVGNDVTELVVARQKARASETTLRNLVEQTPTPLFILRGEDLVLEIANESLLKLWNIDQSFLGKPFLNLLPEMEKQGFYDLLLNVLRTGKSCHGHETPATFGRENGAAVIRYFDFIYQPYREKDGTVSGVIVLATDVTEQVNAKRRLEESEKNFRNMILRAPVAMCVLRGPEHVVEIVNNLMVDLWGKTESAILHKPIFEALPEAKGQGIEQLLKQVFATGERFVANERRMELPRNGKVETVYLNFVYEPLLVNNEVSGIQVVAFDVTEQVEVRHKIEAAEERARLAIESAEMGTFEVNLKTDALISSPRLDVIYGVETGSPRSAYANAIIEEDRPVREQAYRIAAETGTLQYEVRVIWRDGSLHWVRVNGKIYKDDQGNLIKLSGIAQDFTELKNVQELLQAKHEELELVTQVMPQMVWAKNADGYTYFLNKRWLNYTGMKMEELLGWGWMQALHPDDYERVKEQWQEIIETGEPYSAEYRLRCHRGEYKWFLSKGIPVRDKHGKIIRWYGSTTDINSQKTQSAKLETLVEQRTEELRRSNQELEQYAHVASHDMKEPIRKAKLFADRLQLEYGQLLPEKAASYLNRIQSATERLTRMVDGILTYSSIHSIQQEIEPIDIREILKNIETDLELVCQAKGAVIKYGSFPVFSGAPFLVYQLFYNLINNSLKFSHGERPPVIKFEAQTKEGSSLPHTFNARKDVTYLEIKVQDNGIGFHPDHSQRIFETFTRLHSRDQYEGTGMGLALVKRIVDRHEGFVDAKSELGEGTCITVLFPLQ